jgi:hypothetical protein
MREPGGVKVDMHVVGTVDAIEKPDISSPQFVYLLGPNILFINSLLVAVLDLTRY